MPITEEWLRDWLKKHHPGLQLIASTTNYFTIRSPASNGLGQWALTFSPSYLNQDQLATILLAFP